MQLVTGELSDARAEAGSPLGPAKWHPGLLERCQRAWQLERRPRARTSASGTRGGNEWHGGKLAQRSAALPARASEGCSACDVANSWPHFQNGKEDLWRPEPCGHGATTGSKLRKAGPSACPCGFSGSAKTCTYKRRILQSISWQQKQK